MHWLVKALQDYPELALFLTLALGYAVGKIRIGSFTVGSVTGVLLVGVLVGQFNIQINGTVKSVFFLLFLFALGYNVGPQFFKGLKKDGLPQVLFSAIVCVVGLISVIIAGKILGYNAGQAAGLAAGALTQSAVIGVGQGAIASLKVTDAQKAMMTDFVPIGYAVTYIFGTIGSAFFLSTIGPKILGIDLVEESKKLDKNEEHIGKVIEGEGIYSGAKVLGYRAYEINEAQLGKTVGEVEKAVATSNVRNFIVRIRRNNEIFEPKTDTVLEAGDHVAFSFKQADLKEIHFSELGREVSDPELLEFPIEKLDIYIKEKAVIGLTIEDLRQHVLTRGVYISKIKNQGNEITYDENIKIEANEVLTLEGPAAAVNALASKIGKRVKNSSETDVVFMGLGILLGGLIGIPALTIGGIGLSLSTSGGALIMGLIFGYIHDKRPTVGRIPKSAIWFLSNVGLAAFIAVVGINAGPGFVSGFRQSGVSFFIAGAIVTLIPLLVGLLLGRYVFKWNGALTLGACAGAMTTTASIGAICEKAKSNSPVMGYTITYAVGNILLTIWGSIVVLFFS